MAKKTELAPWPQPEGIYEKGKVFDAITFLTHLRQLYEQTVIQSDRVGLSMEYEALAKTIWERTKKLADGMMGFELWPEMRLSDGTPLNLIRDGDTPETMGKRLLLIECLRDTA